MTLTELSTRLGIPILASYRSFVSRVGDKSLEGTAASPAAICAVNLDARGEVPTDTGQPTFFVFETDTGDRLLICEPSDEGVVVKMLSRETGECSDYNTSAADLFAELARTYLPRLSNSGVFVLSKTEDWMLSSIDPITLPELYAAASGIEGVTVFKAQEYKNPFTAETVTGAASGVSVELGDGTSVELSLERGRLVCHSNWPKQDARLAELAQSLRAKVSR